MIPFINIHTHTENKHENAIELRNWLFGKENKPSVPFSFGLHPWYIHLVSIEKLEHSFSAISSDSNLKAIGEIGLDKLNENEFTKQVEYFLFQKEKAEELSLPMIIHCVRAYNEILSNSKNTKESSPVIFHGFNRNKNIAKQLLDKNFYMSFGADLLRNQTLQSVFRYIPLENIFFETDDSELSIRSIYEKASEIKKLNMEELKHQINTNYNKVFHGMVE